MSEAPDWSNFEIDWYLFVVAANTASVVLHMGNTKQSDKERDEALALATAQIISRYPEFKASVLDSSRVELQLHTGATLDDWYAVRGQLNSAFPAYYVNVISSENLHAMTSGLTIDERLEWIRALSS